MHETDNNKVYKVKKANEERANMGRVVAAPMSKKILKPTPSFVAPKPMVKSPATKFKTNC